MKNEKRRLYLLVNDYDYKLFKDLFKILKGQEKDFTEAHLFGAMLYQFCAVSERESSTPHSLIKLPNIKNPTKLAAAGAIIDATSVITMGKRIFVSLDTLFP